MKKLSDKNKMIIQTIFGMLISIFSYIIVLMRCELFYKFASDNWGFVLFILVVATAVSIYTTNKMVRNNEKMGDNVRQLTKVLSMINSEVISFSVIYLCLDLLCDNPFIGGICEFLVIHNAMVNIYILVVFLIIWKLIKKVKISKQIIITVVSISALIMQLNYVEIIFFAGYFLIIVVFNKVSCIVNEIQ